MYTEDVRAYYNQTWFDFRWLWIDSKVHALHFGYWDESTHSHEDALARMNEVMADRIGVREGERVLDAGCGIGGSAVWLAEKRRARATGITLVQDQRQRANMLARQHSVEHLTTFEIQDFSETGFPDASFDVVWTQESVCHLPDKRKFIAEAMRLLKPGGRLIMLEYFFFEEKHSNPDEALLHSWLSGWMMPNIPTGDQAVRWAQEAGFQNVQLDNIQPHVEPSHWRLYWITQLLYPGEWIFHLLGWRSDVQHGNTRGARDQWRALKRGLWFEGILTARKPGG